MATYPLEGPDLSYAQGNANPANFPGQFAIINASRANIGLAVGSYYHNQVDTFRRAGRHIGHYFFNGNISRTICADFFVNNLYAQAGDTYHLDVEDEPSTGTVHWTPAQVLEFDDQLFRRTGKHLTSVYLNRSIRDAYDWSAVRARGIQLWLAYYNPTLPPLDEWGDALLWQYTSAGYDHNRAQASLLTAAAGGGAIPIPQEEDMGLPISFIKDSGSPLVWLVGPVAYTKITTQYHMDLLVRAAKQSWDKAATDPMHPQELDIIASYLKAVGAVPEQPTTITLSQDQIDILGSQLGAAIPKHFALELKGDANA